MKNFSAFKYPSFLYMALCSVIVSLNCYSADKALQNKSQEDKLLFINSILKNDTEKSLALLKKYPEFAGKNVQYNIDFFDDKKIICRVPANALESAFIMHNECIMNHVIQIQHPENTELQAIMHRFAAMTNKCILFHVKNICRSTLYFIDTLKVPVYQKVPDNERQEAFDQKILSGSLFSKYLVFLSSCWSHNELPLSQANEVIAKILHAAKFTEKLNNEQFTQFIQVDTPYFWHNCIRSTWNPYEFLLNLTANPSSISSFFTTFMQYIPCPAKMHSHIDQFYGQANITIKQPSYKNKKSSNFSR